MLLLFTFMQFTILAHIINLLFSLLTWAHVYVNAICLLLTWAHNCVYTFVLVFYFDCYGPNAKMDKKDLDSRTFPMQIGVKDLNVEDGLEGPNLWTHSCPFLICFIKPFDVCAFCARKSYESSNLKNHCHVHPKWTIQDAWRIS